MLEELPIRIRTSNLTRALLFELMEELGSSMESTFDRLDLATGFYLVSACVFFFFIFINNFSIQLISMPSRRRI